ncbi:hypothetical protein Acr_07g0015610 [Actinidia rufa]|uniref:Uncharacterized protein n=1 Tax=Actinidia rufa TaxID=165716 RepID=A0A7J0EY45_9ERIC|nr:hypothetical protein Acr_07g0015610 [Actinidia rufa]
MHDDAALARFRRDQGILNNVNIERPREHEVATMIEGNDDCILVQIWLIHQAGLLFPVSLLLKEGTPCSASDFLNMYNVVWPNCELDAYLYSGNPYLRLRNSQQPWSRQVTHSPDKDMKRRRMQSLAALNPFSYQVANCELPFPRGINQVRKRKMRKIVKRKFSKMPTGTSQPKDQTSNPLAELGRQVTVDDTAQDFKTYLVVAQATMLPCDVVKLKKEDVIKIVCIYDIDWNRASNYYVREAEDRAKTLHEGRLACLKERGVTSTMLQRKGVGNPTNWGRGRGATPAMLLVDAVAHMDATKKEVKKEAESEKSLENSLAERDDLTLARCSSSLENSLALDLRHLKLGARAV